MPADRFYVIVNPAAGRGAAARALTVVEAELARTGAAHVIVQTSRRGEAAALAEAAARDAGRPLSRWVATGPSTRR